MRQYIFLLCLLAGIISACTYKLDIKPTVSEDIEEALSTADGLTSLRNSSYAFTRRVNANYFYHFAEMLADTGEIIFVGTFEELHDLVNKSMVPTFYWGELAWRYAYRAINGCNLILDNIDIVEDESQRAFLEGDARFIRGILYFDLTRFFALPYGSGAANSLAVPLVTSGVTNPEQITYPDKSTVSQVFALVEEDLSIASELLPADETFFANKYTAMAVLSRYYLTIEDYEKAAIMADSVIESGIFEMVSNIFYAFNQSVNSSEDLITWQQTELDNEDDGGNAGMAAFYASTNASGRSEMVISEDFLASTFEENDIRGFVQYGLTNHSEITDMFYEGFGTRARGIYSAKWLDYNTNITYCRLAEMYLTRAEANQMLMDQGGVQVGPNSPVDDINIILNRAGLSNTATVSIDDIRFERYRELIFEGHRLHDYKRWKRNVGDINWDSERLIIPVPKKETDTNPNL
jgi:hypothetical protein